MLYYHENQNDETLLDNEPLLQFHNRSQLEQHSKLSSTTSTRVLSSSLHGENASFTTSAATPRPPPFNVSALFDETDCLVDLSPLSPKTTATTTHQNDQMENHSDDSDNNSDYENSKSHHLDENANIRFSLDNNHQTTPSSSIDGPVDGQDALINFDPNADIADNLLAIFVVSFDAKLGNLIEWQMPRDLDLKHIEFKAMASGFHLISNDLV